MKTPIAVLCLLVAQCARSADFPFVETPDADLADDYLAPTVFHPGVGSSLLTGTVSEEDRDLFTLLIAGGTRLDAITLTSYTTDPENPENLSFLMSQPGDHLSSPPSNDFADPIGYVGFGLWAVNRNVLPNITVGPPYLYASTLGPGSYAFWINETGPVSSYQFQFRVSAIPEPSAWGLMLAAIPLFRCRKRG